MKRLCYVCGKKPARKLKPRIDFVHYETEPRFCSVRCAADHALNEAWGDSVIWCDKHGWQSFGHCEECDEEERGIG